MTAKLTSVVAPGRRIDLPDIPPWVGYHQCPTCGALVDIGEDWVGEVTTQDIDATARIWWDETTDPAVRDRMVVTCPACRSQTIPAKERGTQFAPASPGNNPYEHVGHPESFAFATAQARRMQSFPSKPNPSTPPIPRSVVVTAITSVGIVVWTVLILADIAPVVSVFGLFLWAGLGLLLVTNVPDPPRKRPIIPVTGPPPPSPYGVHDTKIPAPIVGTPVDILTRSTTFDRDGVTWETDILTGDNRPIATSRRPAPLPVSEPDWSSRCQIMPKAKPSYEDR